MGQKTNNRTVGVITGMGLMLCSLPTGWLTLVHPTVQGGFAPLLGPITVGGFQGKLTLWSIELPIWLVVVLGALSLLLALLNLRGATTLPKLVLWPPAAISAVYMGLALFIGLFSSDAELRIGALLAPVGLGIGLLSGWIVYFHGNRVRRHSDDMWLGRGRESG